MNDLLPKERDLLKRTDENEDLRPLFFRKVHGLKWFDHLADRGYFESNQNPAPTPADEEGYVRIPTWQVTDYLVKTAPELAQQESLDYARKFLNVIVSTTDYAQEKNFGNYRTWWQFAEVIRHIPTAAISVDDLRVIDFWLDDRYERGLVAREVGEKWLPALLDDGHKHELALATRLIELIYKVKFVEREFVGHKKRDAILRIDHHYSERITKKVAERAGREIGADGVAIFDKQLQRILTELNNDSWSAMWQPAIEDHEQNKYRDDAENTIVKAYRDSLSGYMRAAADEAFDYVANMLAGEYETIKRIAIHSVDENFRVCSHLVGSLINSEYLTENYRHEMWRMFNRNYRRFTRYQKSKLLKLILEISRTDDEGNLQEAATAYSQANWLAAIKGFGKKERELYRQKVDEAGVEPDHPSFSSFMSSGTVVHESPIPLEELHSMEIDQLVDALENYRGDTPHFMEPGIEGLSKALRETIKASPMKFYLQLSSFLHCDLAYIHQIIEAYKDLWVEKEKLPWNDIWRSLLQFCSSVVADEDFWGDENARERSSFVANRFWIVSTIAMLIEAGTKSDDNAFDPEYIPAAEAILAVLLEHETGDDFDEESDAVSIAINSPRGRTIEALINMTLRSCRLADRDTNRDHSSAWSHFEPYYESELKRVERNEYEFATLVTNYLPNFLYMSSAWTMRNLDRIFDRSNEMAWRCAMQGYAYVGTVYEEIFKFLKQHGHFIHALDDEHLRDRTREQVVQNIGVAYKSNFEDLSDKKSLISVLIDRGDHEELSQLIWLFWTMRSKEDNNLRAKIVQLWRAILDRIDISSIESKRLASKLCQWAVFIDEVDDGNRDLLLRIAPYADFAHNSYELLKSIGAISKSQPFEAYAIWIKLLEGSTPDYPEEAIRETLSNLVAEGPEGIRKAKEIVSFYIRVANEKPANLLRELTRHESAEEA